jgi:predicted RNA-binding protein with PUA-like domain
MAYWLLKTEPETWSWDQQMAKGAQGEPWSGVRNYQARNNLQAMKKGERGLFYHSGARRTVMGIVEVAREAYPDPSTEDERWVCVDVKAVEALKTPVTLDAIRAEAKLKDMVLVKNSRLSVQPVTAAEWAYVRQMGGLKG